MFPSLTPQEVERFVSLGKVGSARLREGDGAGAEAAFRQQLAIFPLNPEPHVSLALVAARGGAKKQALACLRAAVLRGFTDVSRVERSEVWLELRRDPAFLALVDAVPALMDADERWVGWDAFGASHPPPDLESVARQWDRRKRAIEAMAPALGPRLDRLWRRVIDRSTAALLQAYVVANPGARDLDAALEQLMSLYSGGLILRWEILPAEAARRLGSIASTALERFPDGPSRPGALTCLGLARYAERDRRGRLLPAAVEEIRASLREVTVRYGGSPFLAPAVEGLVRTESETGRADLAMADYRAFRATHAADPTLLDGVRERLGVLALTVGGLPDFHARALDGGIVDREALKGKVVVVDFWATWCGPCVEELPALRRIASRSGDRVVVLGVCLDRAEDLDATALEAWIAAKGVAGRHVWDGLGWDSDIVRQFGVKEIPFTVVAAADGSVLAVGEHGGDLDRAVRAAVAARVSGVQD
ncbi:MAG: TlpA family protein disulfide reductase [Acidobacteriia bacterium]|nr:TlpA family protein disulfide reductase [Terriglobia bacterium]